MIFATLAFLFYWYEYRPTKIISYCHEVSYKSAVENYKEVAGMSKELMSAMFEDDDAFNVNEVLDSQVASGNFRVEDYNNYYTICLRANGLMK